MKFTRLIAAGFVVGLALIVAVPMVAQALTGGTTNIISLLRVFADSDLTTPSVATGAGDLYVEDAIEADGALNIGGASTLTGAVTMSAAATVGTTLGVTGDLTCSGGAGALTFDDSASSIVIPDGDSTALLIGSTGQLGLITFDTTDSAEEVNIVGTTSANAFRVDVGLARFDEAVTFAAGAGALTFTNTAASAIFTDNDTSAWDMGSTGLTNALRYSSADNAEAFTFAAGVNQGTTTISGVTTLDASDCGKTHFVDAAADDDLITLPATIAGCELRFVYVGADDSCLIELSPNANDGIHGLCTLAASIVEFSGTDDADVKLTKATSGTGDSMTLIGDGSVGWYVTACNGIWAN